MKSNIEKSLLLVRNLRLQDMEQIARFEELFGYDLSSAEDDEDNDFSFGLFYKSQLLGVGTVGCADVLGDVYSSDYLLSDVGILPEYQRQGLGTHFMEKLLEGFENETVHAVVLDDKLLEFYKQFGFVVNDFKNGRIVKNGGNKMTNFNEKMASDKEMEQNKKYKGLVDEMYSISSQASILREQMKKIIKEFDELCPTEDKAVKQMLEICQYEAREKLIPHFLIQFYGDRYDLLKVGYQLPEDVRYCCEDVNDHFDLRMDSKEGETLELDIKVDADFVITAIRANWY